MGINDSHAVGVADTFIDVIRNFGETVHIFEHKDIRIHEQIQASAFMSGEPGMQMVCQFSETVAVKKKTDPVHSPVEHISLTDFCHDLTGNIFSGIQQERGRCTHCFRGIYNG